MEAKMWNTEDELFTIVATPHEFRVEYIIYEILGRCEDGEVLWHKDGASCSMDQADGLEDAEVFISGQVKWDGCSDWNFDANEGCMIHMCDKDGLVSIGRVMAECWDMTKELCTNWQDM